MTNISFTGWSDLKIAVKLWVLYCVQVLWGSPRCLSSCPFLVFTVLELKCLAVNKVRKTAFGCTGWMSCHVSVTLVNVAQKYKTQITYVLMLGAERYWAVSEGKWGQMTFRWPLHIVANPISRMDFMKLWKWSNYWL